MNRNPLSLFVRTVPPCLVLFTLALFLQGCGSSQYQARYPTASTNVAHSLKVGTVLSARPVAIDGKSTNAGLYGGMAGGSAIGGAVGGHTSGTAVGAAVGAAGGMIVGGIVGPKVEKAMTARKGEELTIELDDGPVIVVVQEARDPGFHHGERVRVHSDAYGHTKIFHIDEDPYVDPDTRAYLPPDFEHDLDKEKNW